MYESTRLIFILGTAYSGSTLLGQILSNRQGGMFVGEIYDVCQGWRTADCSCEAGSTCEFWNGVHFDHTVYDQLLSRWPGLLIDASKYPGWILHNAALQTASQVLVTFRNPANFLFSCYRRKQLMDWDGDARARWAIDERLRHYVDWYRMALDSTLGNRISFVSHEQLSRQPVTEMQRIDARLGIACRFGEEAFWQNSSNHVLGSNGEVMQQVQTGAAGEGVAIAFEDNSAVVREEVEDWSVRSREAYAVYAELMQEYKRGVESN